MKKSIMAFLILCIISLALVGCGGNPQLSTASDVKVTYENTKVVYRVVGTADIVDIVLGTPQGVTEGYWGVGLPSEFTYWGYPGDELYISAYNLKESGTIIVTISVNGVVYMDRGTGTYMVDVEGFIPDKEL